MNGEILTNELRGKTAYQVDLFSSEIRNLLAPFRQLNLELGSTRHDYLVKAAIHMSNKGLDPADIAQLVKARLK